MDDAGNVYVSGVFDQIGDFDPGPSSFPLTGRGFVSIVDAAGDFIWAGSIQADYCDHVEVAVHPSQGVALSGGFQGHADIDPGAGTFNITGTHVVDAWFSKFRIFGTEHPVTVRADDGRGGLDEQSFTIDVVGNRPPEIVSAPVTTAVLGHEYTYDVDAIDPDDDPVTYSIVEYPLNMTIDSHTGVINWRDPSLTATFTPLGSLAVTRSYHMAQEVVVTPEGPVAVG